MMDDTPAKVKYFANDFKVTKSGAFVVCAVSGKKIPIYKLNYWNVDYQEAYYSAKEALIRAKQVEKGN